MFSLLHGLINYMLEKQEYFVPILGLDGAGKTVRSGTDDIIVTSNYCNYCRHF
jgi:hypothetical protein